MQQFLKIENGKPLVGAHVSDIKFQGVSSLNQLEDYGLSRPSRLEHARVKERQADAKLAASCQLHEEIQRRFNKARMARAEAYSLFIEAVEHKGQFGGTPPITLYLERVLPQLDRLIVPYGATILAIDGETQTEARFILRDKLPESGDVPVAVSVYHDCGEDYARQILHDYNWYANPVNDKELININPVGPLNRLALEVIQLAEIPAEKVDRVHAKPLKKSAISQLQVMYAVAGFAFGEQALTKGAADWIDELNNPAMAQTLSGVNGACTSSVTQLLRVALGANESRLADPLVWQVAGSMVARGRPPESIQWAKALAAHREGGRSVLRKLDLIAAAI